MNRSESKYFATAAKMDDAFMELLEQKDFTYITVKEICTAAGVNRSTFYLHYETVGDLLAESVERASKQFLSYMDKDAEEIVSSLRTCSEDELYLVTPEYLVPYLNYVKEHRRLFATMVEKADVLNLEAIYVKMFKHVFTPILDRFGVATSDRQFVMAYHLSGLMAVIAAWLKGGCKEPVAHVVEIVQSCVPIPRRIR